MNLSDEDKATLEAAATILMRDPECVAIDGDDQWYITNQDIAENLYKHVGLMTHPNSYSTQPERKPRELLGPQYTPEQLFNTRLSLLHPEWSLKISG